MNVIENCDPTINELKCGEAPLKHDVILITQERIVVDGSSGEESNISLILERQVPLYPVSKRRYGWMKISGSTKKVSPWNLEIYIMLTPIKNQRMIVPG